MGHTNTSRAHYNTGTPGADEAVTLLNSLIWDLQDSEREATIALIHSWMDALDSSSEGIDHEDNFRNWFENERSTLGYHAPNFKIHPGYTALLAQFRNDEYYLLKNLVETAARPLLEEALRAEGMDARVILSSDADDVCSGVDYIIESIKPDHSKHYMGFDFSVSRNINRLVESKQKRTSTTCHEFNQFAGLGKHVMQRFIFNVHPSVMMAYLKEFIADKRSGKEKRNTLSLYAKAKNTVHYEPTMARDVSSKVLARFENIFFLK